MKCSSIRLPKRAGRPGVHRNVSSELAPGVGAASRMRVSISSYAERRRARSGLGSLRGCGEQGAAAGRGALVRVHAAVTVTLMLVLSREDKGRYISGEGSQCSGTRTTRKPSGSRNVIPCSAQ